MKHKLNLDINNSNYTLLKEIFKIMDSRKSAEILASCEFKNLNNQLFTFKIIFIMSKNGILTFLDHPMKNWTEKHIKIK